MQLSMGILLLINELCGCSASNAPGSEQSNDLLNDSSLLHNSTAEEEYTQRPVQVHYSYPQLAASVLPAALPLASLAALTPLTGGTCHHRRRLLCVAGVCY